MVALSTNRCTYIRLDIFIHSNPLPPRYIDLVLYNDDVADADFDDSNDNSNKNCNDNYNGAKWQTLLVLSIGEADNGTKSDHLTSNFAGRVGFRRRRRQHRCCPPSRHRKITRKEIFYLHKKNMLKFHPKNASCDLFSKLYGITAEVVFIPTFNF